MIKDVIKRIWYTLVGEKRTKDKWERRRERELYDLKRNFGSVEKTERELPFDTLKEEMRHDVIYNLHLGINCFDKNEDYRKASIESFAKSKMTIEEIKWHLDRVRDFNSRNNRFVTETKLPQKSLPDKRNDSSFIR